MFDVLQNYYSDIEKITSPGTVEAGDIMMVGSHYYIGLSKRTNAEGAKQMIAILNQYGLSGSVVEVSDVLHLKSRLAYLENNNMIISGGMAKHPDFQKYNFISVDDDEIDASNCVWINGTVLMREGFPKIARSIKDLGYNIIKLDNSEFRKLDGGLSCLSLRF